MFDPSTLSVTHPHYQAIAGRSLSYELRGKTTSQRAAIVVSLLRRNGVVLSNPTNKQLVTLGRTELNRIFVCTKLDAADLARVVRGEVGVSNHRPASIAELYARAERIFDEIARLEAQAFAPAADDDDVADW